MTSTSVQPQPRNLPRGGASSLVAQEQLMLEYGNQLLVKCVVVGDQGVGKSHLICARASGSKYSMKDLVLQTHISSVWAVDQYRDNADVWMRSHCDIDGVSCSLRIWDTFGSHDRDRQFAYLRADVVVICFSAINRRSLLNVEKFWIPEVRRVCGCTIPIVICACQIDYRYLFQEPAYINLEKGPFAKRVKEGDIVLPEEGRAVARKVGASYYETSVLAQYGITDVFNNAVRACLFRKRRAQIFSKIGNLKHVTKPHLQVPHLPPKPVQPEFEPPAPPPVGLLRPARSRHDLQSYCDVTFIVEGGVAFYAHWVYLIAASPSFHQLYQRRRRQLNLSRSDFLSMGTSVGSGSSSRSQSSSNSTLSGWAPPWRRDGVRIRMSSRIRYLSQNLTATPRKITADDSLSVNERTNSQMTESASDLLVKSTLTSCPNGRQLSDRRASLQVGIAAERYEEDVCDERSCASSVLTLKPLDSNDEDDDDDEDRSKNDDDDDEINNVDSDRVTEFSDIDSGYTNQTSVATSVTCLPSTAFVSVDIRVGSGGVAEESVVVIDEEISAQTFEDVLHYIYTGNLPSEGEEDFDRRRCERLHKAARAMGITDLEVATANELNGETFLNVELKRRVEADRTERMEQMFINQGQLADVLIELEDGTVPAHRALLMCRSDMMVSMFNSDFSERANKTVSFRSATTGGFRGLMFYLYTGQCPEQCEDWASMIELADRLLLPKLLSDIQVNCINHLNKMMSSPSADVGGELTDAVLALVDAAKLHKTEQVARWCQWYLQVNFNEVMEKHAKTFEALDAETQATLLSKRWPPEWYLQEVDIYERALMLMTKEKPEASWLKRPNGEVHDTSHCFGFLRKK